MKQRLLIFELRMIGDAILSLPFIRAAQEQFEVYVACAPSSLDIFEMVLPRARIISWEPPWLSDKGKYTPRRWIGSGMWDFIGKVFSVRAHTVVSVWPDARTHILMTLSGAKKRVGFPMVKINYWGIHLPWRRRQLQFGTMLSAIASTLLLRSLLTKKVIRADYYQHHTYNWRQLANTLGLRLDISPPWLRLPPAKLPADVEAFISKARDERQLIWLVHPGARIPHRRWPLKHFKMVIKRKLLTAGAAVILVEPPEMKIGRQVDNGVLVTKLKDLRALMKLTNLVNYVLCNDSAIAQFAAALGKQAVVIYTANTPHLFIPSDSIDLAVENNACSYKPCLDQCVMPSFVCRDAVTVTEVEAKLQLLVSATHKPL